MEQYQELCARYYEWLDWKSRQESKKAMDYIGNDQENK
jgi:hypothetical protein